jgi:hypothetical protein
MHTNRLEVLPAFEAPLAFAAPVLAPVTILMHVSFGFSKRVERGVAALAVEFWAPVVVLVHMLAGRVLIPILVIA